MAKNKTQSIEPNITNLANGWLKSYKLDYKLEQEPLDNSEIDKALDDYYSKNGGVGGNRPDVKLLLQDKNLDSYPVLIEYKGYKGKLVKLDNDGRVENKTFKNVFGYLSKFFFSSGKSGKLVGICGGVSGGKMKSLKNLSLR